MDSYYGERARLCRRIMRGRVCRPLTKAPICRGCCKAAVPRVPCIPERRELEANSLRSVPRAKVEKSDGLRRIPGLPHNTGSHSIILDQGNSKWPRAMLALDRLHGGRLPEALHWGNGVHGGSGFIRITLRPHPVSFYRGAKVQRGLVCEALAPPGDAAKPCEG